MIEGEWESRKEEVKNEESVGDMESRENTDINAFSSETQVTI